MRRQDQGVAAGLDPEALLAEAAWLKRLAVTLAGDADDADDLVQQSWITAWRRNPDTSRPLRPWLAKVLRDQSRMRRRADARRAQREAAVSDSDVASAPDEVLDQVRLHKVLVDLVLELEEPYRSTVLARYVDGQTSATIAKRLNIAESTVRWRIHEALARLRTRLDEINGERKAWAPAVLAFAGRGVEVAKATKTGIFVVALVLLLLGAAGLWLVRDRSSGDHRPSRLADDTGSAAAHGHEVSKPDPLAALAASKRPPGWFAQEGVTSRRIAGTVLVDAAPAAGALVRLEDEASRSGLVAPREVRTGSDGHFDFGVQQATRYDVGAYIPGRVATVKAIDLRDPHVNADKVTLVLAPCVIGLYGRVLDASGGPIAHAQLFAQGVVGGESNGKGAFDICLEAAGNSPDERKLVVRASGYGALEIVAPLTGRVRHDFMMTPEATISGRVVNAQGAPVGMASVRVSSDEAAPRAGTEHAATVHAVTDTDGKFNFSGIAAGRLRIQAFARGAASSMSTIDVAVGGSKDVTLTVSERGILRGRVLFNGKPLAGVSVFDRAELPTYLARSLVMTPINEAVSQDDGTFVLDDLPVGSVSLGTSPYRLRKPSTVQIAAGEQSLDLEVEKMGALSGTVRRNGTPVAHVWVRASGTMWTHTRTTETDEAGRYSLEDLETDDYLLTASSPEAAAFNTLDKRIRIELGASSQVDIDLRYAARISGVVVDANGSPVAGAFVKFQSTTTDDQSQCISDVSGRFRCGSMTGDASYRVEVSGSEASPKPFAFVGAPPGPFSLHDGDAALDDVRLVVDATRLTISGIVVDRGGQPASDAQVVADVGRDYWSAVPTAVTNVRGEFELRDLSPGSYRLQSRGTDGSRALLTGVPAGTSGVHLVLDPPSCDDTGRGELGSVLHESPSSITNRPSGRITWGNSVELLGWDGPAQVHLGDTVHLTLYYKVLTPLDRSWKVFVHLDGPQMRVNADHEPLGGRCPTSAWKPGDVIVDHTSARIDPSFDAGTYEVWTGFFGGVAPNWMNLPLSDAPPSLRGDGQRLKVTSIEVTK
jgi:RNA polymerase sigma factor (sigma-70 family)